MTLGVNVNYRRRLNHRLPVNTLQEQKTRRVVQALNGERKAKEQKGINQEETYNITQQQLSAIFAL